MESAPDALQMYDLCREFGCLPSQLYKEDNKDIEELIVVMNAINEHQLKQQKGAKRKKLAKQYGGTPRG